MNKIAATAIIHPNVKLGKNVIIEDYCIIGSPARDATEAETVIGDNAIIRSHTVIYAGNRIGNNFQTGNKANIRELNVIGNNVSVGTLSVIEHHVTIADGVRIHTQAFVPEFTELKEDAWLGPNVVITNAKYPRSPNSKNELKGAVVGKNAKIGAGAVILPGVVIGKNALVGAGSVVTKDVADDAIVVGNPAEFLKKVHY
jgi:acetyltransferase-like isoleucine patch superfamily enzyme